MDRVTGAAGAIYVDVDDERVADDVPVSSWDYSLAVPVEDVRGDLKASVPLLTGVSRVSVT